MLCPICKESLKESHKRKLETIGEHVTGIDPSMKMSYECTNIVCTAYINLCWNNDGEMYKIGDYKLSHDFIDGNNGPFFTLQRKLNVEIYKDDENYIIFSLFGWKFKREYIYKSNECGDILKRSSKIKIITRCGVVYVSGISMLIYTIRRFHSSLTIGSFGRSYIKTLISCNNKKWWSRIACFYAKGYLKISKWINNKEGEKDEDAICNVK